MSGRLQASLRRERWTLSLFVAGLVTRLHWNLAVHPPEDYVYSDMHGYVSRGLRALARPFEPVEYDAFFPFGNHWLIAAVKYLFGAESPHAMGVTYAVLGAIVVALGYLVARRTSSHPAVAPAVGLVLVFYYPLLSLGGYALSEIPYTAGLLASHLFLLRLMDTGRTRDALLGGLFVSLALCFRPQILLSVALLGLFWLRARRHLGHLTFPRLTLAIVPVLLTLTLTSWRFHHHTGRFGLVSENATLNYMFGRCHASKIVSLPDGKGHGRVHFQPPAYLQMRAQEKRGVAKPIHLNPALGYEIEYKGYIGDGAIHRAYVRKCVAKTGLWGQIKYSVTNLILLWKYNIPWPDSGRRQWRRPAAWWQRTSRQAFALPALLALALTLLRPAAAPRTALAAVHVLALLVTAALFFGSARLRTPYDPFIILLACQTYAHAGTWVLRRVGTWLRQRAGTGSAGPSPSQANSSG